MPRQRYQTGRLFKKGKRRKQWYGRYYVYVLGEEGEECRKFKLAVLGAVADLTKTDAQRKLQAIIDRETAQPGARPDPSLLWQDFVRTRYLPMREQTWKPRTRVTTLNLFEKHLIPAFIDRALDSITRFDCQQWINNKATAAFSGSVVHHCRTHLSAVLKEAVRQRYLDHNPADGLLVPETAPPSKRHLTAGECRQLAAALVNPRDRLIFRLCVLCGLRPGECFALRWDDRQGPTLRIDESLEGTSTRVGTPKTPTSAAPVVLCSSLTTDLDNWRIIRQPADEREFLFGPRRRPMSYAAWLRNVLQPIAKGIGIHGVTFQCLRRTFSTLAQRHGTPKDIQAQMRHADVATTLGVYQQVIPESVRSMVEALDAELTPLDPKPN
jgi:integrase